MKKTILSAFVVLALAACGNNALDGSASTDTTNLPVDTGGLNNPRDTANHVNTSTGEYPNDTLAQHNVKGDVRSSSPSPTNSRSTTPGNDTVRQKQ